MKEIRNNIIKRTVLWMSMFSVLLYSTRVCGITNLIAQAAEKDAPESDFVIEEMIIFKIQAKRIIISW